MTSTFSNLKLDKYEQEIENLLPEHQLEPRPKKVKRFVDYAKHSLSKKKNINLRLPEITLVKIKAKAMRVGLPYQTYIGSILHQAAIQ